MDSAGIGLLVQQAAGLREAGGDVRLARLPTRIKNQLVMARALGRVFDEYPTVDAALASYAAHPEGSSAAAE
jgi:anti-anti-sigma regulatory factor